jgi:hypothetical protein
MRRTLRLAAASLISGAVVVALHSTPVSASRCYIDEVDYYEDGSCYNQVGAVARGCAGTILWQWGDVTSYWNQQIDGGTSYCGCGGDEYHTFNPGTCPS